ncbi:MAG: hypothetical protein ACRAVC_22275 [Trichormus sp.]
MLDENKIRQAASDVQQSIPNLNTWNLLVYSDKYQESQVFSYDVELTEPSSSIYPLRYIRVTLRAIDTYQNLSNVFLEYGSMLVQSGNFSIESVLDSKTFDNQAESAMKNVSFVFPPSEIEAQTNLLTSLAYEFLSRLIQILASSNHPESQ